MSDEQLQKGRQRNAGAPTLMVAIMTATEVSVDCPHCSQCQVGFIGNPAGEEFECDDCGGSYRIHAEADIEM